MNYEPTYLFAFVDDEELAKLTDADLKYYLDGLDTPELGGSWFEELCWVLKTQIKIWIHNL